jgi:hypothetical protein
VSRNQATVPGRVRPDGTLEVTERVDLPPGPVRVTVMAGPGATAGEPTRSVLRRIGSRRQARGAPARTKEQIDAEIAAMRDEDDERLREIETIVRPEPRKQE